MTIMNIMNRSGQSSYVYRDLQGSLRRREDFFNALKGKADGTGGPREAAPVYDVMTIEQALSEISTEAVKTAWEKTLEETGFEPFPWGHLSTADVLYHTSLARSEVYGTPPMSLRFNLGSAIAFTEQIIERLNMPLVPGEVRDPEFVKGEKEFYNRFLENLKTGK